MFNQDSNYQCVDIKRDGLDSGVYAIDFGNTKNCLCYGLSGGKWGLIEAIWNCILMNVWIN